jgi:hypothetical protein
MPPRTPEELYLEEIRALRKDFEHKFDFDAAFEKVLGRIDAQGRESRDRETRLRKELTAIFDELRAADGHLDTRVKLIEMERQAEELRKKRRNGDDPNRSTG